MAGLYIHIPFCKSRCIYCAFYSTTSHELRQRYVDAVCREMKERATSLTPGPSPMGEGSFSTIYIGGGTPSQLTPEQLRQIVDCINETSKTPLSHWRGGGGEATLEANPDDITVQYAAMLSQLGITRVSMGAQTFDDRRLRFLHRRHTSAQVAQAVRHLREAGIRNISIDLMYGFPDETLEDWERDIDAALALNVEHISAYCLTVEEGTALYRMNVETVGEELEREMYYLLKDKLEAAGFEHYEISNFARPGYRSRHNSSYWQDVPYIGLGAAAHSYDGKRRSWNVADIRQYIAAVERGERPCEEETIDEDTWYNDRITTALRTREGLDLTALPEKYRRYCLKEARRYIDQRWLAERDGHLALTRDGLFVSDDIMSSLIYI